MYFLNGSVSLYLSENVRLYHFFRLNRIQFHTNNIRCISIVSNPFRGSYFYQGITLFTNMPPSHCSSQLTAKSCPVSTPKYSKENKHYVSNNKQLQKNFERDETSQVYKDNLNGISYRSYLKHQTLDEKLRGQSAPPKSSLINLCSKKKEQLFEKQSLLNVENNLITNQIGVSQYGPIRHFSNEANKGSHHSHISAQCNTPNMSSSTSTDELHSSNSKSSLNESLIHLQSNVSFEEMFRVLLENNTACNLYTLRKEYLKPQVIETVGLSKDNGKVTLEWVFPLPLQPYQSIGLRNSLMKKATDTMNSPIENNPTCIRIIGKGEGTTKDIARKVAVRHVLDQAGLPTIQEILKAFGTLVKKETIRHNATVNTSNFNKKKHDGFGTIELNWFTSQNKLSPSIRVIGMGPTSEEALAKARAQLVMHFISNPITLETKQVAKNVVLTPNTKSSTDHTILSPSDISEIMQRSQLMLSRLGIEEKCNYRFETNFHWCDIKWNFTDEKGLPCSAVSSGMGNNKKTARALARTVLLEKLGVEDVVPVDERLSARKIKSLITENNLPDSIKEGISFIMKSTTEGWNLILPILWKYVIAQYDLCSIQKLLLPLQRISNNESDSRQLSVELWETLLDASIILHNSRIGFNCLALLTGGSSFNCGDKLEAQSGFSFILDKTSFPCLSTMEFFQSYRAMLSYEFRAELTQRIASQRFNNFNEFSTFETTGITLTLVEASLPLFRFKARTSPEIDAFLQNSNLKEDELALLRPVMPDYNSSSNTMCVVRVTNLSLKNTNFELTVRLATDESLGQLLNRSTFTLYALSTCISIERMLAALKILCLSKWPLLEKRPLMYFSTPLRYILLYPNSQEAKDVAKRGPVPKHFIDSLTQAGITSSTTRKLQVAETISSSHNQTDSIKLSQDCTYLINLPQCQGLSENQRLAILSGLTNRLTLIQGPPGTGKTHTACSIIHLWTIVAPHRKILAVADSNVAADNISNGLAKQGIRSARVGAGSDVDIQEFLRNQDNSDIIYDSEFSKQKAHKYERMKLFRSLVASNRVVITTCIGSGHPMFEDFQFDRVIIDECAHSTEPASLVPLSRGCNSLVLIGDVQQLNPMVLSREAHERGLNISLMERLTNANVTDVILLDIQRRMHPSIAEFPNFQFYNGCIRNENVNDTTRPPIPGFIFPNPAIRVCLIKVQPKKTSTITGFEGIDGSSKINTMEAQCLLPIIQSVLEKRGLKPTEIGILTPYSAQKKYIKKMLSNKFPLEMIKGLEVDTIDGFQGKEKDLIIFSAVRSNPNREVGFLEDGRRMNVMLTRARRGLIVLADTNTLMNEKYNWSLWLEWVTSRQAVISCDKIKDYLGCFHPDPHTAESIARAVSEGRLINLWPTDSSTTQQPLKTKMSAAAAAARQDFYVDAVDEQQSDDDEDWYGDKAAEAANDTQSS